MSIDRIRRHRLTLPLATLVLLFQALGGGVVALAHGHTAHCPVLHDEVRCALCQYAGAHVTAPAATVAPAMPAIVRWRPVPTTPLPLYAARVPSAPPPAPPPPSRRNHPSAGTDCGAHPACAPRRPSANRLTRFTSGRHREMSHRMHVLYMLAVGFLPAAAGSARAQRVAAAPPPVLVLSRRQAIDTALAHNP